MNLFQVYFDALDSPPALEPVFSLLQNAKHVHILQLRPLDLIYKSAPIGNYIVSDLDNDEFWEILFKRDFGNEPVPCRTFKKKYFEAFAAIKGAVSIYITEIPFVPNVTIDYAVFGIAIVDFVYKFQHDDETTIKRIVTPLQTVLFGMQTNLNPSLQRTMFELIVFSGHYEMTTRPLMIYWLINYDSKRLKDSPHALQIYNSYMEQIAFYGRSEENFDREFQPNLKQTLFYHYYSDLITDHYEFCRDMYRLDGIFYSLEDLRQRFLSRTFDKWLEISFVKEGQNSYRRDGYLYDRDQILQIYADSGIEQAERRRLQHLYEREQENMTFDDFMSDMFDEWIDKYEQCDNVYSRGGNYYDGKALYDEEYAEFDILKEMIDLKIDARLTMLGRLGWRMKQGGLDLN